MVHCPKEINHQGSADLSWAIWKIQAECTKVAQNNYFRLDFGVEGIAQKGWSFRYIPTNFVSSDLIYELCDFWQITNFGLLTRLRWLFSPKGCPIITNTKAFLSSTKEEESGGTPDWLSMTLNVMWQFCFCIQLSGGSLNSPTMLVVWSFWVSLQFLHFVLLCPLPGVIEIRDKWPQLLCTATNIFWC